MRWLLPVQVPGRHRLPVKLFVHAMPPAGGLSLNATTAGAVRLVQLVATARNLAGNPDSPQAVVFLTSVVDVTVGY